MSESPPASPVLSDEDQAGPPTTTDNLPEGGEAIGFNLVRQSADGGSTQSLGSTQDGSRSDEEERNDDGGAKERDEIPGSTQDGPQSDDEEKDDNGSAKERENITEDLDKDIDAMVESTVATGQMHPVFSVSSESGYLNPTSGVVVNMEVKNKDDREEALCTGESEEQAHFDNNLNKNCEGLDQQEKGSFESDNLFGKALQSDSIAEKSFTSDTTDSSAIAEAVVKSVLNKAVDVMKSDGNINQQPEDISFESVKEKKRDQPVGLFQYGGFDDGDDVSVEDEESDSSETVDNVKENLDNDVTTLEKKDTDVKVGLFQYYDDSAESSKNKSPEVSEIDDTEERVDSLRESENENILKLYGLEDIEVTSPKSPSDVTGTVNEDREIILDVQREVYEPQTRQFSVSHDSSSAESTPRYESKFETKIGGQESADVDVDREVTVTDNFDNGIDLEKDTRTDDSAIAETAVVIEDSKPYSDTHEDNIDKNEDDIDKHGTSDADNYDDNVLCGTGKGVPFDVSPPLIQYDYESVKENGKFRIVKMPKEGGGSSYTTIRVGTDTMSPKQSPRDTPVESDSSLKSEDDTIKKKTDEVAPSYLIENQRKDESIENASKTDSNGQHWLADDTNVPEVTPYKKSADIDRERIRQLVEKETDIPNKRASPRDYLADKEADMSNRSAATRNYMDPFKSKSDSEVLGKNLPAAQPRVTSYVRDDIRSPKQMSMSELRTSPRTPPRERASPRERERISQRERERTSPRDRVSPRERKTSLDRARDVESDLARIRYTTTDTSGRATQRTGPSPYEMVPTGDQLKSESRYLEVKDQDESFSKSFPRDRYTNSNLPAHDTSREGASGFASSYQADLIQSAYERVNQRERESNRGQGPHQSMESGDSYRPTLEPGVSHRSLESGVIPGFKTLQEQQASWSSLFHTLEEQHRSDLQSQYDQHQHNIRRLQQQMELELQKQHLAIRKRLDIHKEALLSPEREQRYGPTDRDERSPERSPRDPRSNRSQDPRSWREIYREVREEEEKRDPTPPPPLKRALNNDFDALASGEPRSGTSRMGPSSPPTRSTLSRVQGRPHDKSTDDEQSFERSKAREDFSSRSVEGEESRPYGRESRSRSKRPVKEPIHSLSPRDTQQMSPRESRMRQQGPVSPYVQELLENLSDSRSSLRGIQGDATPERPTDIRGDQNVRPRAGVYSSPMPMMRTSRTQESLDTSHGSRSVDRSQLTVDQSRLIDQSRSIDHSRINIPVDRAEFHEDRHHVPETRPVREREETLSSSGRMNLREKHSKHLADLRAYYEDEMRELRRALSESMDTSAGSGDTSLHNTSVQRHLLEAENKHLLDKCRAMEDEIEELYEKVRSVEQKNSGLEKRASEYSGAFAESQAMGIQHQAHIEELQRYCRERDDLVNDLESKVRSQDDSVKIYKKSFEEEMELHRQDKIALQRIIDKYECVEREHKLLQETMASTENKLYETRTDVVELNRTISKLELENKRLGRENDNLRHKVTQSLNLSSLHDSFGTSVSPRTSQPPGVRPESITRELSSSDRQLPATNGTDKRVPGFATSSVDWAPAPKHREKDVGAAKPHSTSERDERHGTKKMDTSVAAKSPRESKSRKTPRESTKGRNSDGTKSTKFLMDETQHTDAPRRQKQKASEEFQMPSRDTTPPRPSSATSMADSEVSDYSPLIKAERELFKLRDMMRQAVAVKPSNSPPQPKLQKKFYGSERPSSKEDYSPDLGASRGRKEKPSSHSGVAKTKSSQAHSKSDKTVSKSERKSGSRKSEKTTKSGEDRKERQGERTPTRDRDRTRDRTPTRDRDRQMERDRELERTPPRKEFGVRPVEFGSPTRFDISVNEETKTLNVTPRKTDSPKQRNLTETESRLSVTGSLSRGDEPYGHPSENGDKLEGTLDRMRSGQYMTRPQWEDVFTSMARKQAPTKSAAEEREQKVKGTIQSISEMESRYDGLQVEKRQLESTITKIPLHGRINVNNRRHKEELEDRLDAVEKELGSLKMSLKRYNVLKTAG